MRSRIRIVVVAGAIAGFGASAAEAATREIADLGPVRLSFGRSVINELTYDTYRDPFDELQSRPYNLLYANIGRHPNLGPWPGQEGIYTRYFDGLIGNNGAANVDNDADAIQGALIRRETPSLGWGVAAAFLDGSNGSRDANGTATFSDDDDVEGFDVRGAAAWQMSDRRVIGGGLRLTKGESRSRESNFEPGTGGFRGVDDFDRFEATFDGGLRSFLTDTSSWEIRGVLGWASSNRDVSSDDVDAAGIVTDRFVVTNYDLTDVTIGVEGGYNRLRSETIGETEFRGGLERAQRKLDNSDLSYADNAGVVTPVLTLLGQDTVAKTSAWASAKTIFRAGETEMFAGAVLAYRATSGTTRIDDSGTPTSESVDDTHLSLGLTVGLRQPFFRDKLRFVISGRADVLDDEEKTSFEAASTTDSRTLSTARYAIGLEGVLANVTFDLAWLVGDEAAVVPVPLGLPAGSRRTVELDRLVFSAAVSW